MRSRWLGALALVLGLAAMPSLAQKLTDAEVEKIRADATAAAKNGPTKIALAGQASLDLPANRIFVPQPHAGLLLKAMGNPGTDPSLHGLIFPNSDAGWFMTVRFENAGYIKDDDAKDWNAEDMLKTYREGTEASNDERIKMGATPLEVVGWAEPPRYDAGSHRLVWAMSLRDKGAPADARQSVNYNTYALGREGYFKLNLVTALDSLGTFKPEAATMLAALNYNDGKRYADFNSSTDRVAEYGLGALVVGIAAKKLGLFAMIGVFFAKFIKIILLAVAGLGAAATKLFKRKSD